MTVTPPGAQPVITIRDLRFRYPGTGEDVLRVPFLDVPATGMTAITGPSGAGKSTLIELLAGTLWEPYEGSVQVLGTEWRSLTRDADRQRQLRRIGLIPQDYGLLTNRTPAQLLEQDLADGGVPKEERAARAEAALGAVALGRFADRDIAALSGGQRQRVAIARMLARQVECVIADEPTANLDPALTAEAMQLFRRLAEHVPVVIITHDPAVADACDRTIVLQSAVSTQGSTFAPIPQKRPRRVLVALASGVALAAIGVAALVVTGVIPLHHKGPATRAAANRSSTRRAQARVRAVSSARASPITSSLPVKPTTTQVIVYEPWAANGLAKGIRAASAVSGYCWSQSLGTVRPDAYRCATGNYIFDPCFASPYPPSQSQVACA
jgi:putative ABC transport system ATP-binding protein